MNTLLITFLLKKIKLKYNFKNWNSIDTFLKSGTKLTHQDKNEYNLTN